MHDSLVIRKQVTFATKARGKRVLGVHNLSLAPSFPGRVPRVARLMALAIKMESVLAQGRTLSQTDLAELGHVTKARVTQLLNLTLLSPAIQAALLDLPLVERGHDPLSESDLRPICAEPSWARQETMWMRMDPRRGNVVSPNARSFTPRCTISRLTRFNT
ncbi:MAG: hypothetical protein U0638_14185 [Phycisphaerales bacterium]